MTPAKTLVQFAEAFIWHNTWLDLSLWSPHEFHMVIFCYDPTNVVVGTGACLFRSSRSQVERRARSVIRRLLVTEFREIAVVVCGGLFRRSWCPSDPTTRSTTHPQGLSVSLDGAVS